MSSLLTELAARQDAVLGGPAFTFGHKTLTPRELDRSSRAYAAGLLALGVGRGDRVAVLLPSRPELVVALVGHLRAGVVHVPINTRYREAEVAHILADSGAKLVLHDATTVSALRPGGPPRLDVDRDLETLLAARPLPSAAVPDDATAMLVYTSGTTGTSKGVTLTHAGLADNVGSLVSAWGWTGDDVLVLALPLFHVHGLGLGLLGTLLTGNRAVVLPRFDSARVVAEVAAGATIFMGVPTMYALLLEHLEQHPAAAAELAGARLFTSGSAALPADHFAAFRAATGHAILERYGMTETGFTLSNPYDGERRPGTVGQPVPGCEVRLVDDDEQVVASGEVGEIQVRSNGIMAGYWGRPIDTEASFAPGQWFRTGDVARRDPDGPYRIVGRRSVDIIKSGGFKVGAREIEDVIRTLPGVRDAAVIGLSDDHWGERIVAVIAAPADAVPSDPEALSRLVADHVAGALADYKKPRQTLRIDALPRNALGKVQKHRVRDLFAPRVT